MENYSEERPWGGWTEYHHGDGHRIKELRVHPGHRLSYQYHNHRSEHWFVVQGTATITLNEEEHVVETAGSFDVPVGARHRIANAHDELLRIVEVQYGMKLDETDIVRLEDDYAREGTTEGGIPGHIDVIDVVVE